MSDFKTLQEAYINIYKEDIDTEHGREHTQELITQLLDYLSGGSKFASFLYRSKGLGETSIYNVRLNVDYARTKAEDRAKLEAYTPENEEEQKAKDHLLAPSTRKPSAQPPFTDYGKGIKINNDNGKIYLFGYLVNKEIVADKSQKADTRKPLTIACDNLKKKLNIMNKTYRSFILDPVHISGIRLKGDVIEFQQDDHGQSTGS